MTTSTPPAWHFLHECDAPVTMEELSIHSRNLPDSATLREQNDSDQCANGEQNLPSTLIPSDQCAECRCAPGHSHAKDCDISRSPVISCDRKHDNLDDEPSLVKVESCPECGTVTDIEYDPICDEVRCPDEWPETGNPLHAHMRQTFDACLEISVAKNADYASSSDPLANFRACQQFGVPLTRGIMVRLSDKFARIGNLLENEAQVKDEAIADTINDAVNYLAILKYALEVE